MASANSNTEIMKLIIKAGIDLNLQNSFGNTALRKYFTIKCLLNIRLGCY